MTAPQGTQSDFFTHGDVLQRRYRIEREIGRGGYSIVYQAMDLSLGTDVALKLLVPPPALAHIARERMRREARAVRGLLHPNIVALHDYLEEGPWSFVVMELVRGLNLAGHVAEHGPLPVDAVTRIGREIASALTAAHRHGILHRDVKPQNVLIDVDGTARLTDFGSARLQGTTTVTQTGGIVGTIPYTAPEMFGGHRGDARSDVYSLGVTLYFALTTRIPHGPSRNAPPTPSRDGFHPRDLCADLPDWLDAVVARATTESQADRYPTASAVEAALRGNEAFPPTVHRESCLVCEGPEFFGIGVCPRCASTSRPDDMIILVGPCTTRERQALETVLSTLLTVRVARSRLNEVAAGERALLQVPGDAAGRVVQHLALRSIPARAVRKRDTWRNLPVQFYLMLALIAGVGGWAGLRVMWELLLVSPLVSLLLWLLATRAASIAVIEATVRDSGFSEQLERRLVETFVALPSAPARCLLADLVRLSKSPYRNAKRSPLGKSFGHQIESLLECACDGASYIAALDARLAIFGELRESAGTQSNELESQMIEVERSRDGLVHKFLEAMTTITRADALVNWTVEMPLNLTEVTAQLEEDVRIHREATEEMELALRS